VNAGKTSGGDAVTITSTSVSANTDVANTVNGANCTVQLDFDISKHEIFYSARNIADSPSKHETRTGRQHEFGHVGARNALASKTLLTSLCTDVGVKWTFSIKSTSDQKADQEKLDATARKFEKAVEDFINPLVDFLDEKVVHETQRKASMTGRPTDSQVAAMLSAISYVDPTTGTAKSLSTNVIAQVVTAIKKGETAGETHAKNTSTPDHVKPPP